MATADYLTENQVIEGVENYYHKAYLDSKLQRRTQLCAALLLSAIYLRILSHDFSKIFADKYGCFL